MIELINISKHFDSKDGTVVALNNVSLEINDGDIYGIIGVSGAGKSTLVRCINMLDRPTEGTVKIDGIDLKTLNDKQLREKRREISMIFQNYNLLMQRTCLHNICFPMELSGTDRRTAEKKAAELLDLVGLSDKANAYPAQLSGGQRQRVAIARALATNPKVLLCDEATSALDPTTTNSILELIRQINESMGITVIIITHQMSVVENVCNHVAILDEGSVVEKGDVGEVFSHPKSQAARKLVFPEGSSDVISTTAPDEHILRVVFNGAKSTNTPLIARMAVEKGIEANITYASARTINDKVYGYMILGIKGTAETVREAIEYFTETPDTIAEEVIIND